MEYADSIKGLERSLDKVNYRYEINIFPWGRPRVFPTSFAELSFDDNGIHVGLYSDEHLPHGTVVQPNGPVYLDSCLEFFFCPCPEQSAAYFNFEINCLGTLYTGYSPSGLRSASAPVEHAAFCRLIAASATINADGTGWNAHFTVPYAFIRENVPHFDSAKQRFLTGNFYKCGDATKYPHYAVWNPIDPAVVTKPDFHVPAYFGKIEIPHAPKCV